MRAAWILALLVALVSAVMCFRLGLWQLSRMHEKRALNAALDERQRAPVRAIAGEPPALPEALDRPLELAGRFDEAHQFLLSGRAHAGEPGVEVVTPFMTSGGSTAVLVNRGWLPAADASTARPQDHPEPGERTVRGMAEELPRGAGGVPPRRLRDEDLALWSVRTLDADSIAARLAYPVAGYALREAPGPGVPDRPRRSAPRRHDETMHLGYAIQWFLFGTITLGGTAALAWSRRRRAGPSYPPEVSS